MHLNIWFSLKHQFSTDMLKAIQDSLIELYRKWSLQFTNQIMTIHIISIVNGQLTITSRLKFTRKIYTSR
jgi:hypothetical protein